MTEQLVGQMSLFAHDTQSTKTCRAHSQVITARTTAASSKNSQRSQKKVPLFLNLQKVDGVMPDAYWETDGASLGAYMTHSFGEKPYMLTEESCFQALPNGVSESLLSQILVDTAHPKYSLSAKACKGILNRASRRGKELPKVLKDALESQVRQNLASQAEKAVTATKE